MVHQIADENGTLRHIILSVMDIDDNSQLNSSIIDLPHGSFRINSHGELVSADHTNLEAGIVGSSNGNADGGVNDNSNQSISSIAQQQSNLATSHQHLPQHQQATTYYANYDGCPVANYELATQDNTNSSNINNHQQLPDDNNDVEVEAQAQNREQKKLSNNNSNTNSRTSNDETDKKSSNQESMPSVSAKESKDNEQQQQQMASSMPTEGPPTTLVANDSASAYHHNVGGPEVDQSTMIAPLPGQTQGQMLGPVDEHALYGYPPCCCCCYCDPSQEANPAAAGHQQHNHQAILGSQAEPASMMMGADGTLPASNVASGNRNTANMASSDHHSANGGVLPYPHHHQHQPAMMAPIQADPTLGVPLNMGPGSLISSQALHPLTGQNGLVPMHASGYQEHLSSSSVASSPPTKPHKGSRGSGAHQAYKQAKGQGQQGADRHQANYGGQHHYGSQSYGNNNNMMSGSTYYHQDASGLSPSSYASPNQGGLLAHPGVVVPPTSQMAGYSSSYASYSQPATMANVVSSGKQQHQSSNSAYSRPGELDHHLSQRNGRLDHHMMANTVYGGPNVHLSGYRNNHQHVENKRQPVVGDKSSRFGGTGTGAAPAPATVVGANNRVITNNHVAMVNANATTNNHHNQHHHHQTNSGNNSNNSSIGGSVSPFRPNRMKNSHNHNQHHNSNNNTSHHQSSNHLQPPGTVAPNNGRTNQQSSSSFQNANNSHKINREDLESSIARAPNQSAPTKTAPATKNLNANHAIPSMVVRKHIRSNERNSSSPSSNHSSSYHNQSNQSPHGPKQTAWHQKQSGASSSSSNLVASVTPSNCGTPTPLVTVDQNSARKAHTDPTGARDNNYACSPEPGSAERPTKGQPLVVAYGNGSPRSSRGKQKKSQKENKAASEQVQQTKRQHSNDEARKSAKNHRPRSSNEPQQQQQQPTDISMSTDNAETSPQQVRDVQSKRSNRSETSSAGGSKSNQVKVDPPCEPKQDLQEAAESRLDEPRESSSKENGRLVPTIEPRRMSIEPEQEGAETTCGGETEAKESMEIVEPPTGSRSDQSPGKGESPVRKKSKSGSSKQSSPKLVSEANSGHTKAGHELAGSRPSDDTEDVLIVTNLIDTTTPSELKPLSQTVSVSMRTSLSENNIQSLNISSLNTAKSTQTTPQKHPQPAAADQPASAEVVVATTTATATKKKLDTASNLTSKRKSSNGKTEQQFKLNSLPQIRLFNLNCVSVTSNSVSLRWSHIPAMADKFRINYQHHHHGGSKHSLCFDHYVVECSGAKNVHANTLVSSRIVYQGCAMTCRVNNLTPEKIYHFRIRRTALVPSNDGDTLAVSEILSVTLPSTQQQQQQCKESTTTPAGPGKKSHMATDSNATPLVSTFNSATSSSPVTAARGNTSSQINAHAGNISNIKSSSSHHHNHNHHHHHHNHQPIKFSSLMRQCRNKITATLGTVVQNSFSSYSDTKFALLLVVVFTIFAMLLAIFIHLYILPPVNE